MGRSATAKKKCKEERVSNPRYNMVFVWRNCSVRKNMDQNKWAVSQNVAPAHLIRTATDLIVTLFT